MVLLADLPEITAQDLTAVLSAVIDHPDHLIWRGATALGKPGHPVVFDQSLFSELSTLSGDEGAQSVVRSHLDQVFLRPLPGEHALLDLDTPEDWARWRNQR
jgi:CTP:molybdopterin cytidylyltransferase MocA